MHDEQAALQAYTAHGHAVDMPALTGTPLTRSTWVQVSQKGTALSRENPYNILHTEPAVTYITRGLICLQMMNHASLFLLYGSKLQC